MLTLDRTPSCAARGSGLPHRQRGVILMVALIMLVAMTLAGLALVRSVDTGTLIAGNLAFQESAMNYGDIGATSAAKWLQGKNEAKLSQDDFGNGYSSNIRNPAPNQSWDNFWINTLVAEGRVFTLPVDPTTGNTVSYAIQRMCSMQNVSSRSVMPPNYCAISSSAVLNPVNNAGDVAYSIPNQVYYRVTTRTVGPRNAVSYTQTLVAI